MDKLLLCVQNLFGEHYLVRPTLVSHYSRQNQFPAIGADFLALFVHVQNEQIVEQEQLI